MIFSAPSPIGTLQLTFGDEGLLVRVERGTEVKNNAQGREASSVKQILNWFEHYAKGQFRPVPWECLSWSSLTLFQGRVLKTLLETPPSEVTFYGELAERSGSPKGQQAVGQALTRNPFPVIVPCHRVLPKDLKSGLGGFAWGSEVKRQLLEHEGWCA